MMVGYKELLAKNLIRPFKAKYQQIRNQTVGLS
jgi:hypothetical protein